MNCDPVYATAAALAGVAREVEHIRRELPALRQLPDRVDELAQLMARLAEDAAAQVPLRPREVPPAWLSLPSCADGGQGEALATSTARLLAGLTEWMGRVYLRYADAARTLPACWLWHAEVVEELLWLRAAWCAAYTGEDASVTAVGDWHDRLRPGVVRRIREYAGLCSIENHQPSPSTPAAPLASAVPDIARWWVMRRDAAAPEPTDEQVGEAATFTRPRSGSRGSR